MAKETWRVEDCGPIMIPGNENVRVEIPCIVYGNYVARSSNFISRPDS